MVGLIQQYYLGSKPKLKITSGLENISSLELQGK